MSHMIGKPVCVGLVGGAAAHVLYGGGASIDIMGRSVPLAVALGATLGAASAVAEIAHATLFPLMGSANRLTEPLAVGVSIATTTSATALLLSLNNARDISELGMGQLLMVSVAAEVGGTYLWEHLLSKMLEPSTI